FSASWTMAGIRPSAVHFKEARNGYSGSGWLTARASGSGGVGGERVAGEEGLGAGGGGGVARGAREGQGPPREGRGGRGVAAVEQGRGGVEGERGVGGRAIQQLPIDPGGRIGVVGAGEDLGAPGFVVATVVGVEVEGPVDPGEGLGGAVLGEGLAD